MEETPTRSKLCQLMLSQIQDIPGDVIELGIYRGHTTFILAQHVRDNNLNKRVYACDSFVGLPYTDKESGINSPLVVGECKGDSIEIFTQRIKDNKFENIIIPIPGLFEDTLIPQLNNYQFCFAWIDPDLYKATSFAYKFLEERISVGGIIGFHDYHFYKCPGVDIVVDKEVNYNRYIKYFYQDCCMFIQRIK
jgi:hypothetical protein